MADALLGLKFLRALPYVDSKDVAVIGHSLEVRSRAIGEREPNLRALVVLLRSRLQL